MLPDDFFFFFFSLLSSCALVPRQLCGSGRDSSSNQDSQEPESLRDARNFLSDQKRCGPKEVGQTCLFFSFLTPDVGVLIRSEQQSRINKYPAFWPRVRK